VRDVHLKRGGALVVILLFSRGSIIGGAEAPTSLENASQRLPCSKPLAMPPTSVLTQAHGVCLGCVVVLCL